jgi:anti-sigma B factor antagonist
MNDQTAQAVPVVVVLPEEIDVTNSGQVYERLVGVLTPGVGAVVADMTATAFCDSSGVHAIMHAHETAAERGAQLRLAVSEHTSVQRVLQLIGVSRLVPVYSTLEEALAS